MQAADVVIVGASTAYRLARYGARVVLAAVRPALGWLLLLALGVSGCAIVPPSPKSGEEHLRGHYILAHEDGYPISADSSPFRVELSLDDHKTDIERRILAGIDMHARRLWPGIRRGETRTGPLLRLLLFVHGGLNGYKADFDRMRGLLAGPGECVPGRVPARLFVSQACDHARTGYYPVFVNWNSDLVDSIRDDLFFIRFGDRSRWLGLLTWPFVLGARLAESILSAPSALLANVRNFRDGGPGPADWAGGVGVAPVRVLTTPILKAFGTSAWQIMKRRAELVVAPWLGRAPSVRDARDQVAARSAAGGPRQGSARTLVEALESRIVRPPEGETLWRLEGSGEDTPRGPVEVTLLGHSMGALVLNRILAANERLPIARIVYLAPASSLDEIEGFVEPYLRKHEDALSREGAGFSVFTLNRRDEARERDPSTLLPRGTLLVWIDNFFEGVGQPGDRRFGRFKSQLEYYGNDWPPSQLNVCELDARFERRARKHADMDDAPHLERALWRVDRTAFRDDLPPPEYPIECTAPPSPSEGPAAR